jgi:uncharacterized membrane protein required for colicin V production
VSIWIRTYLAWGLATFAAVFIWIFVAHLMGVGGYDRGFVAGTITTLGCGLAFWRAELAEAAAGGE